MNTLPSLGVGLTYFPGLEPVLGLIDVLEVEPQVFWRHISLHPDTYGLDGHALQRIIDLPFPKLVHSVANPVGGSHSPDMAQIPPLRDTISMLKPSWISEHLSFNSFGAADNQSKTGFLLPLRQTMSGVRQAARSIRALSAELRVPLAVETGVSYLRPSVDELPDGIFITKVVERANCGLLLDMHNIWTNHVNQRQPMDEFLSQIPLNHVWEVHLAGGFEEEGYWLDAHSGEIPGPLLELVEKLVPKLHGLRAIIFEMYPSFLSKVGLDIVARQLNAIRKIWNSRSKISVQRTKKQTKRSQLIRKPAANEMSPLEWENRLGNLVVGHQELGKSSSLSSDPGILLYRKLIGTFRSSMIAGLLKLSTRLLMLTIGDLQFEKLLHEYWAKTTPQLYASDEAVGFARFVLGKKLGIRYLEEVLAFETTIIEVETKQEPKAVQFQFDPFIVLNALTKRRLPPSRVPSGDFELVITAPGNTASQPAAGDCSTYNSSVWSSWHH